MWQTVSARQIQREYKTVLKQANLNKQPIVMMSRNKPLGDAIGLDLLEKLQLEMLAVNALNESILGKTKVITNEKELIIDQ